MWLGDDTVKRNNILVTLMGQRVNSSLESKRAEPACCAFAVLTHSCCWNDANELKLFRFKLFVLDLMADIGKAINLTLYSHIAFHFNYIVSLWFIIFPLEVKKNIYYSYLLRDKMSGKHFLRFFSLHFIIKRFGEKKIWRAVHFLLQYISLHTIIMTHKSDTKSKGSSSRLSCSASFKTIQLGPFCFVWIWTRSYFVPLINRDMAISQRLLTGYRLQLG